MWKSPCRRPLCSFHLWRSNNHSLLREVYWLGTVQTFSFWLAQSDFISVFGKRSFLQEECSQTRWLLGSVIFFFFLSSECVDEIQSTQRLTADAPLPTMEPNKRLWNCSRSRNYISSLPNSLGCRLVPLVIMWPTRTMVHCCLIWETKCKFIMVSFFCLWHLCEYILVFMCLRIPEVDVFDRVSTLRTEGGSLIWTQHWLMWLIKQPVCSRDSEHCGSRQASVCPTLMWVSRLWTQVLTLMPMKSSLPTEPFSQLQNYAGILLFYVIIKIS